MPEERLDVRLARENEITRSRAETLIRQGQAQVNGCIETKPGRKVKKSDSASVIIPPPVAAEAQPEDLPLEILYEDDDLAVVVKPCGMVVHPAAGNEDGTLVNALLFHLKNLSGIGGALRPGIVHRLDKDTSGLLLVAKNDAAHLALSNALKAREIHKTYRAVARGSFREPDGVIEAPIGRSPKDRKKMAIVPDGRYARTEYRVLESLHGASLVDVNLITGRTHQIRVHFAYIGHPLLGDPLYGGKENRPAVGRLMLHARRIEFTHPTSGKIMVFEAPEPPEFLCEVEKLRR